MNQQREAAVVPPKVFALVIILAVELLMFSALLISFVILKSNLAIWPPYDQPRLPIYITGLNSINLLMSGVLLNFVYRKLDINSSLEQRKKLANLLIYAGIFSILFLVIQGIEWFQLIEHGLSMSEHVYGSIFVVIIGFHAVHVLADVILICYTALKTINKNITSVELVGDDGIIKVGNLYSFFVIGIWPCIYFIVYL